MKDGRTETRTYPLAWDGPDRLAAEVPLSGGSVVLGSIQWDNARPHPLVPVELPYSPEFQLNQNTGRELTELLRAAGGRERIAIEETWDDLPKRLRAFPLTPFFCLAAILLFLFEIAERRFLLIGRFFIVKQRKEDVSEETGASSALEIKSGVKLPHKHGKTPRPVSNSGTALSVFTQVSEQDSPRTEESSEPAPADSISAALKKARRR